MVFSAAFFFTDRLFSVSADLLPGDHPAGRPGSSDPENGYPEYISGTDIRNTRFPENTAGKG